MNSLLFSLPGDTILCVANLSRTIQPVEHDLTPFRGMVPVEMLGHSEVPGVGDQPYFLSLGAYGFNWFRLQPAAPAGARRCTWRSRRIRPIPASHPSR
jgi:maltose alpha-D-glucosyltransferase/alpha-amylase